MKVSRLSVILFALLAAIAFALVPVGAGEHPWNEGDEGNGGDTRGSGGSNSDLPDIIRDMSDMGPLWGSSLWWLQFIPDNSRDQDKDVTPATAVADDGGKTQTTARSSAAH